VVTVDVVDVLCAQLARDLLAIAKFLSIRQQERRSEPTLLL